LIRNQNFIADASTASVVLGIRDDRNDWYFSVRQDARCLDALHAVKTENDRVWLVIFVITVLHYWFVVANIWIQNQSLSYKG
jgi:hypothetical protein